MTVIVLLALSMTPAHAASCPSLAVTADPVDQAVGALLEVTGALPGASVWIYAEGADDACAPGIAPTCLDLVGGDLVGVVSADAQGRASAVATWPVAVDATPAAFQVVQPACDPAGLSPVVEVVVPSAVACAYGLSGWAATCDEDPLGCVRDAGFADVYPTGLHSGAHSFATSASVEDGLLALDVPRIQLIALQLSVDFDAAGWFGARTPLAQTVVGSGPYVGYTAEEIVALGAVAPVVDADLADAAAQLTGQHEVCPVPEVLEPWVPPEPGPSPVDTGWVPADSGVGGLDTGAGPLDTGLGLADTGLDGTGLPVEETGGPAGWETGAPVDTAWAEPTGGPLDTGLGTTPSPGGTGLPGEDTGGPAAWDTSVTIDTGLGTTPSPGGSGAPPVEETGGPAAWDTSVTIDTGLGTTPSPGGSGSVGEDTGGPAAWDTSVTGGGSGGTWQDTSVGTTPSPGGSGSVGEDTGGPAAWDTSVTGGGSGGTWQDTSVGTTPSPGGSGSVGEDTGGPAAWDTSVTAGGSGGVPATTPTTPTPGGSGAQPAPVDTGLAPWPVDTGAGGSGGAAPIEDTSVAGWHTGGAPSEDTAPPAPVDTGLPPVTLTDTTDTGLPPAPAPHTGL